MLLSDTLKRQKLTFKVAEKPFEPLLEGLGPIVTTKRDSSYSLSIAEGQFAFVSHCDEEHWVEENIHWVL